MSASFYISTDEMLFLQCFLEVASISGFDTTISEKIDEKTISDSASSLLAKEYISNDENGIIIDEELEFFIKTAADAIGYFKLDNKNDEKSCIYFKADTIILIIERNEVYKIMWLPFLPLAVGYVAETISFFLNEKTHDIGLYSDDSYDTILSEYFNDGYKVEWEFESVEKNFDYKKCVLLSDGNEQIMVILSDGFVAVTKPDMADLVNALTKMFAPIHGRAIRIGGVINVDN